MLHLTNPCAKRKILSLTKPKGKIYKTKSIRHYITGEDFRLLFREYTSILLSLDICLATSTSSLFSRRFSSLVLSSCDELACIYISILLAFCLEPHELLVTTVIVHTFVCCLLIVVFNRISTFLGYLMPKPVILEGQQWYYLTHSWENKGFHTFPDGICPKVNVIVRLKFELAYYNSAVQRFNQYTSGIPPLCMRT